MTLIFLTAAWITGLVLAREAGMTGWWPVIAASFGLVVMAALRKQPAVRLLGALLISCALGGFRYQSVQPRIEPDILAYYNDTGKVVITGHIAADPRPRSNRTELQVRVDTIKLSESERRVNGQVVVAASAYQHYQYGQRVVITGTLTTPPIYDDFNYREYLAARGVLSVVRSADIQLLPGYAGDPVMRLLLRLNHGLRTVVERILPQPESGLLQGVLLGVDDALPQETAASFRLSGLTHILVVSGFNISVLLQMILSLAQKAVRRQLALMVAMAGITFFGLMVGFSAPVQRAWLMGALTILAWLTGRRAHALTSLAAASLCMTAVSPLMLWSVSFQLSFAATLALIGVEPAVSRVVNTLGVRFKLQLPKLVMETATTTLAAQMLTLPIIWHHFGEISLVSLFANILVLPLQPLILLLGAAATALGAVSVVAGRLAGHLVWPLLRYTILVPQWLGRLSYASLQLPRMSLPWMLLFYTVCAGLVMVVYSRLQPVKTVTSAKTEWKPWLLPGALALAAMAIWGYVASMPDGRLDIYFLDVGQGDAILIRSPGGRTILVDGGADGLTLRARLGETLSVNQHHLDVVIATHGDSDHIGGLVDLPARFQVDCAVVPPVLGQSKAAAAWEKAFRESGIPLVALSRGASIVVGGKLRLELLHPPAVGVSGDNADSLVLRVSMGRFSALLTGDIDKETELALLASGQNVSATVLKVAHHGSDTSSSDLFLRQVAPEAAVISVGADNKAGHPSQQVIDNLAAIDARMLRTDQQGTIRFSTDGAVYYIRTEH